MARKSRSYLRDFVIGFGFLSGIWTAIGIDPQEVLINAVGVAAISLNPDPAVRTFFILLPSALLLLAAWGAYRKGKMPGIAAVIIAYVAGLSILVSLTTCLVLLLAAILIGFLATDRRLAKRLPGR